MRVLPFSPLVLIGSIVWTISCGDAETPQIDCDSGTELVQLTPHFEYHYCEGDPEVHPDIFDELERHVDVLSNAFGIQRGSLPRIRYLKSKEPQDVDFYSPAEHSIRAYSAFHAHELIHAYTSRWGQTIPLLTEGVAMSYSCQEGHVIPVDWRTQFETVDYGNVGRFVAWLVIQHGIEKFRDLYQATPAEAKADEFAATFERIYEHKLDDAWAEAMAQNEFCIPVWACSAPSVGLDETFALSDDWFGAHQRVLELASETGVVVDIEGPGFRPLSCDGPPYVLGASLGSLLVGGDFGVFDRNDADARSTAYLDLLPGRYAITHYSVNPVVARTRLTFSEIDRWKTNSCADERLPIPLRADEITYVAIDNSRIAPDATGSVTPQIDVVPADDVTYEATWSTRAPWYCSGCSQDECAHALGQFSIEVSSPLSFLFSRGNMFSVLKFEPKTQE